MRDVFLIFHFIGLAMGIGTSFAFMFLGIASSKMNKAESQKFTLNSFAISRMGHIGLTLLLLSGIFLMAPFWDKLPEMPLLILKLVLVFVLIFLIGMISINAKNAQLGKPDKYLKKIEPLGKISLLTGIVILILAVYIFH